MKVGFYPVLVEEREPRHKCADRRDTNSRRFAANPVQPMPDARDRFL